MAEAQGLPEDPVVSVGFAFRLPQGAVSEESFWNINYNGLSTNTEVPASRYNINGHHSSIAGLQGTVSSRSGHFIQGDIAAFDAPFFKMSAAEAKAMDPQIRLLLETTYHAFESAGIPMEKVQGSNTSVYVGNLIQEYTAMFAYDTEVNPQYAGTGNSFAMLSNRISFTYDLHGSSVSVDSACSSGLVGLELACESLLRGDSEMSLVGGVQLQLDPRVMTAGISRLGFLSPDGHCYSFDERANGYARGEGVAVMVLKRLSKAVQDGDTIRGVIRGTGSNSDGRTASIAMPSTEAQAALIQKVYHTADLDYNTTGYFEAHGTGTSVGDPIETRGIGIAFSGRRSPGNPIYVGSHKANIGHTEAVAGIVGLVKCIMMLERGIVLPNGRLKNLNPDIEADKWHLKFPMSPLTWPTEGLRRASVNSFGYGGTNAHVVVDDAAHYLQSRSLQAIHNTALELSQETPNANMVPYINEKNGTQISADPAGDLLFMLSAGDEPGIERQAATLSDYLGQSNKFSTESDLRNLAFTLSNRRSMLPWKSYVLASTRKDLENNLLNERQKPVRSSEAPLLCFVFTGQGAQWASMGSELLAYPTFKESLSIADAYLQSISSEWSILEQLLNPVSSSRIDQPDIAQPLCTALQIGLVDLLKSWNISPQAVTGHSSGEIAAAYAAGLLTRESALHVAFFRGYFVAKLLRDDQAAPIGGMLAVGLSEVQLEPYIASITSQSNYGSLTCGCINSPQSTTASGDIQAIDELSRRLQADQIFSRKLNVPVAYHSHQMSAIADSYRDSLQGHLSAPVRNPASGLPIMISSVTCEQADGLSLSQSEYWVQNLVSRVNFSGAVQTMCSTLENDAGLIKRSIYLIELGPHCSLERPIRDTLEGQFAWVYDTALRRNHSSMDSVKRMAGRLATQAYAVDIQALNSCGRHEQQPRMLIDLPKYQFNHSQSYWVESRASHSLRMRESTRHELLGIPSADWNPLDPTWRIIIRHSDLPWLSHHTIDNTVLYPAGGMLAMVLEGIRSLAAGSNLSGYRIRDVIIGSALVVPSTEDGVEAQLHFSSHDAPSNKKDKVWNFWIHSVKEDDWKLHCSGQVLTETKVTTDDVSESPHIGKTPRLLYDTVKGKCDTDIDTADFYQVLRNNGVQFGKTFKSLYDLRYNKAAYHNDQDHETVYKAIASISFKYWREQELPNLPNMIPTQISDLFFSQDLLDDACGTTMNLYGGVIDKGVFGLAGEVTALSPVTDKILVSIHGLQLTGFHQASDVRRSNSVEQTSLFHQFTWQPDVTLLSGGEIEWHCQQATKDMAGGGIDDETETICRHFLSLAIRELSNGSQNLKKPHLDHYVRWALAFFEREAESTRALWEKWPEFADERLQPGLIEQYASKHSQNELLVLCGRQLVPILTGQIDASELLFTDGLAELVYRDHLSALTTHRLAAFIDLLAHKNSDIRIIEIGAGIGGTTISVLESLSRQGRFQGASLRADRYEYTDVSPSRVASAKEQFTQYGDRMHFQTLGFENDPEEQGFESGSYDVVIAASVLHATSDIDDTLRVIKKLLKPGGHLVLSEPTNRRVAAVPLVLGLTPDWWRATGKYGQPEPLLSSTEWNEVLLRTGFEGLQVSLPDNADEQTHGWSLLVSRSLAVSESPKEDTGAKVSVIIVTETPDQERLAAEIQSQIVSHPSDLTCQIRIVRSVPWKDTKYDHCICLLEVGKPVLSQMTESQFKALGRMLDASGHIIWVTENCGLDAQNPEAATNVGFGQTIKRERPGLGWVTLNVQSGPRMSQTIVRVFQQGYGLSQEQQETELTEVEGVIWIPRVVEAPHINSLFDSELQGYQPEPVDVSGGEDEHSLKLKFSPGRLDSFYFGSDPAASQPLENHEVRVAVKATGINFKDVMVTLNQVADDHIGQEFAGVVTEVGSGLGTTFNIGDRVCGIEIGTFRSILRAKASRIVRIPHGMPFTEATAIPLAYATAHYGLEHLARLQPGETVLIHAAAGAVGQATIHLAQRIGAIIYATVSTREKKQLLMDRYGLQAHQFFSSRHTVFAQQIMQATEGKGVDVVLNSLAGQGLVQSWRCVAPFGRFIEIGKRDIATYKALPMEPFMRNVSFCSLDINVVLRQNGTLMKQIMQGVQALIDYGKGGQRSIAPHPITVFKRSRFEKAFRLLQTGRHVGKVVIDWEQKDTLKVASRSPLDYTFDGSATYIISGGFGGIGRSIADWMYRQGAQNLVLLSRSGPKSETARELIAKLEKAGVYVHTPICDISDDDSVKSVMSFVTGNMPPVKGCIQASMALDNRLFENYDLTSFQCAFKPKVKGTINLHNFLPNGLDFFVLLSSLSSIHGAVSQSNYAAANSFLDAFARTRHAQGQRCTAINLGIVDNIGYIAERQDVLRNMSLAYVDHKSVRESDVYFLLKYACNPRLNNPGRPWETQILAALTTPAFVRRGGVMQDHVWMCAPVFRHLYRMELGGGDGAAAEKVENVGLQLRKAKGQAGAADIITQLFARRLARSLGVPVEDVDVNRPPHAFGVDSLVAVELIFWFLNEIRAEVAVVQILGSLTIAQLCWMAAEKSEYLHSN